MAIVYGVGFIPPDGPELDNPTLEELDITIICGPYSTYAEATTALTFDDAKGHKAPDGYDKSVIEWDSDTGRNVGF